MKALILRQDAQAAAAVSRTLMDKGFQILCVEKLDVAHALIRVDTIDLLVMDERIDGQLTHAIALSGERKNPYLSAILLTDRTGEETDDLYALIPALYALAGMSVGADVIAKLALSAVSNTDDVMARVARQIAVEKAEQAAVGTPEVAAPKPLVLDDIILAEEMTCADEEPSPADLVFAQPEMAAIRALRPLTPLERMDDAISAEIAAIFRREGLPVPKTLTRVAPPLRQEAYEVMGGAV
jgi:hypothetical protein